MGKESIIVGETSQTITIKKESLRYLDTFIKLKCAPDLLALGLFPNAKEITESMAMYNAVSKYGDFKLDDPEVGVTVVGDGSTPRTAALFAFRSAWQSYSIDPNLRAKSSYLKVKRLSCLPFKVQGCLPLYGISIVVFPHAHVFFDNYALYERFSEAKLIVSMPCCEPYKSHQQLWDGKPPTLRYHDWGVHSPQREILVWKL